MLRTWLNEQHSAEESERILGPLYDKVSSVEAFTLIYEARASFWGGGWHSNLHQALYPPCGFLERDTIC